MKHIFSALVAVCLLTSCTTHRVQSWMDPAFEGRAIGKTMVLAIGDSDSSIRQFETLFVNRLTELNVEASSLHALLQRTDKLSEEELADALQQHQYSSILVTRVLSETERQQVVTTGYYPSSYGSYYGYYSFAYSMSASTATIQSFLEFEIETNLYDVETRKLVWTGRKIVYDNRSDLSNMKKIVSAISKDLRRKGLL